MRQYERWPLHLGNDPGHNGCLACTGRTQEGLMFILLVDTGDEPGNGFGLIASGLVRRFNLK